MYQQVSEIFVGLLPSVVTTYTESLLNMYTSSPINFSVLSFLLGGMLCYKVKARHWVIRLLVLVALLHFMKVEIARSTQTKENYFKLLNITHESTSYDFHSALRSRKGMYHPDNQQTGNNDVFIRLSELGEAMQTHFKKRMDLYYTFGDSYDILSQQVPYAEDENVLVINRGIEFVANYLMVILITFLFFNNSAARGLFQKLLIAALFLIFMVVDMIIDYRFELEEKATSTMAFADTISAWIETPFATVPELVTSWRLVLVWSISLFYFYGILFQPKEVEILLANTRRYFLKLHRAHRKIDKEKEDYNPKDDIEESWQIVESIKPSIEYVRRYGGQSEGMFRFLNSILSYMYYGFVAVIILGQLYSKYHRQFHAWLNGKPVRY